MCQSNNGSILSTIVISTLPNITLHARVLLNNPLSLIAACPATNSVSPSERFASGLSLRYIEWHLAKRWPRHCVRHQGWRLIRA